MDRWKVVLLKFVGIGLGLGLAAALALAGYVAYLHRPVHQPAWDTHALTTSILRVNVQEDGFYNFFYSVKNNTDKDFSISSADQVTIVGVTENGDITSCSDCLKLRLPLFIPAHESAQALLTLQYKYPGDAELGGTDEQKEVAHKAELAYLTKEYGGLDGFAIFDDGNRTKIVFKSDWKK